MRRERRPGFSNMDIGGGYSQKEQAEIKRAKEEQGALETQAVGISTVPEEPDYAPVRPTHATYVAKNMTRAYAPDTG